MRFGPLLLMMLAAVPVPAHEIPDSEYRERRSRILERLDDGILLLHARPAEKALDQHGFKQEAAFFYFTGLAGQPAAVLALDGERRSAILFVPPDPVSFGFPVEGVSLAPGPASARRHGLDEVRPWEELVAHLEKRLSEGVETLYVDEARRPEPRGNPEGLPPMSGEKNLWRHALAETFPSANIQSAADAIREMRWAKSSAEIVALREVGRTSASALLAGMRAIAPERRQREAEIAVVKGCVEAGAEGPSFWPWVMSGENAHVGRLVRSFLDYHHNDRLMRSGELARMDIGCDVHHYEGDVGRTVPVSGEFSSAQKEAWDLLITAYRAGLGAIRAGAGVSTLAEAARAAVREAAPSVETDHGREAARVLESSSDDLWHVHGVGLDAGESRLDVLAQGSVIAFEPMFAVGTDAYYLEDMILVTENGHEILSKGLPYLAEEVEAAMRPR